MSWEIASLAPRFWARVDTSDEDGCWPWLLNPDSQGYGQLRIWDKKNIRAHRLSYLLNVGAIPDGMVVMHRCDNRLCVRPDHLTLGSRAENLADCRAKGRWHNRPKTKQERVGTKGPSRTPPERRLWDKVEIGGHDECWPFIGKRTRLGYGRVGIGRTKYVYAHRVAYIDKVGPIPDGLVVMHICDNPPCCNPAHLALGTRGDNNRDRSAKGRGRENRQDGAANPRARLTETQVSEIRRFAAEGMPQTRIAEIFSVRQPQVSRIVRGVSWR